MQGRTSSSAAAQRAESDVARDLTIARLEQLTRRQAEALSRRIDSLASEPRPDKLLEQTLKAFVEQLGGDAGTLCVYEDPSGPARCVEYGCGVGDTGLSGAGAVPPSLADEAPFRGATD